MQAQRAGARRFKFNPLMVLTLAAALLLAVAMLAANDVVDLPFTSESETASTSASNDIEQRRARYIEQKFQLPAIDFGATAQSIEHMRFLEQNLYLADGALPLPFGGPGPADESALSVEQMLFLEQNIWDYAGLPANPSLSYPADQLD